MTIARYVPLANIRRRRDARAIDRDNVEGLKASIRDVGLLSPVVVRHAEGGDYELIAGNHRFIAVQELGEPDILAIDLADLDDLHAELAMIDENLRRSDPSPAERSAQVARRKEIYERLHPETKNGATGNGREKLRQVGEATFPHENKPVDRFTSETARVTGRSERAVQRDAERGEKIVAEALDLIRETRLDTGIYLDKLKRLPAEQQVAQVKRDLAAPPEPKPQGGIAGRYQSAPDSKPDPVKSAERFIALVDEIETVPVDDLVSSGRMRAVVGQRASGLADRMAEIMERLNR